MSIRERGEGALYLDKARGLWIHEISYKDAEGKRRRKKFKGRTRAIAKQKSYEFLHPAENVSFTKDLSSWLMHWLENIIKNSVESKTFEKYKSSLKQYIIPFFGAKKVDELSCEEIQSHFSWLHFHGGKKKEGISTSTVNGVRRTLIEAIEDGINRGYFSRNVVKATKPLKLKKKEIIILSTEEEAALIHTARTTDDIYYQHVMPELLQLTLRTGMRRGEVFGLLWENIDVQHCCITIRHQLKEEVGIGMTLDDTKTKTSRRKIAVAQSDIDSLMAYKKWQEEFFYGIPIEEKDRDLVFKTVMGKPFRESNFLRRHFQKLVKAAGLNNKLIFHDLRHTHATRLLQRGINPKVVQERLGHSSIKVTMDTYSHVLPDIQQSAVAALGERY